MNRRKKNTSLWSLGLAGLLTLAALVGATGTSLARYRAEFTSNITFTARPAMAIRLGQLVTGEDGGAFFAPDSQSGWELTDDHYRMTFAVSNMIAADVFAADDQQVAVRLVGTPGIWDGTETVEIALLMPVEEVPEDPDTEEPENPGDTEEPENPEETIEPEQLYETITATPVRISQDSPLYKTFGDGWCFSFLDEDGKERRWTLTGGSLSVLEMTLTLKGEALTDPSLLQLQVIGE